MTQRLYHADAYATDFEARVTSIDPGMSKHTIALDATLFYPESGGQPGDTGTIGGVRIEETIEKGDRILHLTSQKPAFKAGEEVKGSIDWPRRFSNMQQHTGQHILSQAFLRVLEAPTISSKLGTEHSTVDIARLDLTWEDMEKVERLSNAVVFENRPVSIYRAKTDEVADLRLKKPMDRDWIRVVEVEDFDKSPCGGTHTRMTGEIGLIKILRWEKVRETARVEFICGDLAEADYFWKSRFIVELAKELTTKDANVPGLVGDLYDDHKHLRRRYEQIKKEIIGYEVGKLEAGAHEVSGVGVVTAYFEDRTAEDIREMAAQLTEEHSRVALLGAGKDRVYFIFARSADVDVDMRPLINAACDIVEGRGGGKPEVCQGGGKNAGGAAAALRKAGDLLQRMLRASA